MPHLSEAEARTVLGLMNTLDAQYKYHRTGDPEPILDLIIDAYHALANFSTEVNFDVAQIMVQTLRGHFMTVRYALSQNGVVFFRNGHQLSDPDEDAPILFSVL